MKMRKPCDPGNSELWDIDNPGIFRTLKYLKPDTYSELSERFNIGCFAEIVKSYILELRQGSD